MAIDNTPPRLRLIATIGAIVVVTLIALNFVFESYFAYMSDDASRAKLAPTTERDDQRKAEAASITAANVDKAMLALGQGQRADIIEPKPSEDVGPLTGWAKMPKPQPAPQGGWGLPTPSNATGDAGAPVGDGGATATATGMDGGAATAKDGGAAKAAKDGGANAPAPAKDGGAPKLAPKPAPKADAGP